MPVDSIAFNLNNRSSRKRHLKDLKADHGVVLADSAVVALEGSFVRGFRVEMPHPLPAMDSNRRTRPRK